MSEEEKKELEVHHMTFDDLLYTYENRLDYLKRIKSYGKDDRFSKSDDYIKGYKDAVHSLFQSLRIFLPDGYPEIRKPTDEEIKQFTIKSKHVADSFTVAVNKIYGIEMEEGKEYEFEEVPNGIMEYRGQIVPVYSDDPGQQDYCIFRGESYGGGTYNFHPEEVFATEVDNALEKDMFDEN